ncbi:TPA: hypothetical protein ACN6VZ_001026 [Morganella morganii]|uniref:hypothetical protein n=1 Tax=Morganella morganii TaxID=582 RepID=UPI0031B0C411
MDLSKTMMITVLECGYSLTYMGSYAEYSKNGNLTAVVGDDSALPSQLKIFIKNGGKSENAVHHHVKDKN